MKMRLDQLLKELSSHKRNIQSIYKLLSEISRLDKNQAENLTKLKARLDKLEGMIKNLEKEGYVQNLKEWINRYKSILEETTDKIKRQIGVELENHLKNLGLILSGHYPELRAGLFTIELDFDKWRAVIWYGPKQERLSECLLSTSAIVKQIEKVKKELGSGLKEEDLLKKLFEAYNRVAGVEKKGEYVPIIKVLTELAYLLQNSRFHQDPKRENYKSYSRANFSYDLFRIHRYQVEAFSPLKVQLKVATREYTRQRTDFLWVPVDENGRGTTYSHLLVMEV
ncbi:MAG: hypothetical protein PWQ59_224 [Thermoanaerobacterium sp.]|jgi:DNA repair exonuclease SbcCD ATPase subunit|nr:hypothetical protein [Thermoanaerobacterium sp.]MDK2811796.1 hypothetical protein [Petrotoga sp.]